MLRKWAVVNFTHLQQPIRVCYFEWQELLIGQFEHPQPQEVFPFFLFRIIEIIIAVTIAVSTKHIIIVAKLSKIHKSILFPSIPYLIFW